MQRAKVLLCRSSRDSWEDSEFYQAKTVKTHSNNLVVHAHLQIKSFYHLSTHDITYVRKCTLSRFTVLHVTGSWARAWERVYHSTKIPLREVHMHYLNVSSIYASTVVLRKRAYRRYTLLCAQTRGWADISNIAAFYQEKHPCLHYHNFQECIAGYCTPVA